MRRCALHRVGCWPCSVATCLYVKTRPAGRAHAHAHETRRLPRRFQGRSAHTMSRQWLGPQTLASFKDWWPFPPAAFHACHALQRFAWLCAFAHHHQWPLVFSTACAAAAAEAHRPRRADLAGVGGMRRIRQFRITHVLVGLLAAHTAVLLLQCASCPGVGPRSAGWKPFVFRCFAGWCYCMRNKGCTWQRGLHVS